MASQMMMYFFPVRPLSLYSCISIIQDAGQLTFANRDRYLLALEQTRITVILETPAGRAVSRSDFPLTGAECVSVHVSAHRPPCPGIFLQLSPY